MSYSYRWFYLGMLALMLALAGFYFLEPAYSHLLEGQEIEKQLLTERAYLKKRARSAFSNQPSLIMPPPSPMALLSDLLMQAQLHGLTVQSTRFLPNPSDEAVKVKLVASAPSQEVGAFIASLTKQAYPMGLLDFSYESVEQGPSLFSATIFMLPERLSTRERKDPLEKEGDGYPFCHDQRFALPINQGPNLKGQRYPVQLLKMIGSFREGHHQQGLLLLPNQDVMTVEVGMRIGQERGLVSEIAARHVAILLPDKKLVTLPM